MHNQVPIWKTQARYWQYKAMALCIFMQTSCIMEIDQESLTRSQLGEVVQDCIVPLPPTLQSWGSPQSLEYPEGSLWIWNHVHATDGSDLRNVAAWIEDASKVCNGQLDWRTDAENRLRPLLELTEEERNDNAVQTDGKRWELEITGGFVYEGRGYLYYQKRLVGPDPFEATIIGMGVCSLDTPDGFCVRTKPEIYPGEPTLLWDFTDARWNRGAFVDEDGYAYLYGCHHAAGFVDLCSVIRVLPAEVEDPKAYEVREPFDRWGNQSDMADVLFENAGALTAGWNPHHGQYLVLTSNIWDSTLKARFGPSPYGPFSRPTTLLNAIPPDGWFIDGGRMHPGLSSSDNKTIALTYHTNVNRPENGLHLVTFLFD